MGAIIAICALVGALAGIAGSAAAPSKKSSKAKSAQKQRQHRGARMGHRGFGPMGRGMRMGGPPVHVEAVVPNAAGDGFDTVTEDNGKLKSVDGTKLTVTEGTDKKTYGEPTIDVGSDAKVFRNHEAAKLSDLQEGDFVHVIQSPKGNLVMAESADFRAQEQKDHGHFRREFGPPPGGPPPPGAPAPGSEQGSTDSGGSNS